MIGPNNGRYSPITELIGGGLVIVGGNYDNWNLVIPFLEEEFNLVGVLPLTVHQDGVSSRICIRVRPAQCLLQTPTCNKRLHTCHDAEVRVALRIFTRFNLECKLLYISERLCSAIQQ